MFDKNKVLSYKDLIMSIFKSVREKEVRASDRLFSDYKQDDRPISIEDAKYLIDIAIARDNINDKKFRTKGVHLIIKYIEKIVFYIIIILIMWCLWCGKRRALQKQRSKPMMRSIRYSIDKTRKDFSF